MDGLDNSQRRTNRQIRLVISTPESVQEMQVLSGAYSAEFWRAAGGIINVVSRSGSNQVHGSGIGLYRPNETSARAPLAVRKAEQTWWMMAGNLSGPLVQDRIFFFINDEYNPLKTPQPVTIAPEAAQALKLPASVLADSPFGETFHTPSETELQFEYEEQRFPSIQPVHQRPARRGRRSDNNQAEFDVRGPYEWRSGPVGDGADAIDIERTALRY